MRCSQDSPSNPRAQANPTSTALHPIKPPTSHHSSKCLLIGPRSPTVKEDVSVNKPELRMRLLKTTRMKRAGDGMHANGELCAAVVWGSRAGRVLSLHDTVRFLGVFVAILGLQIGRVRLPQRRNLSKNCLPLFSSPLELEREKEKAGRMFGQR